VTEKGATDPDRHLPRSTRSSEPERGARDDDDDDDDDVGALSGACATLSSPVA